MWGLSSISLTCAQQTKRTLLATVGGRRWIYWRERGRTSAAAATCSIVSRRRSGRSHYTQVPLSSACFGLGARNTSKEFLIVCVCVCWLAQCGCFIKPVFLPKPSSPAAKSFFFPPLKREEKKKSPPKFYKKLKKKRFLFSESPCLLSTECFLTCMGIVSTAHNTEARSDCTDDAKLLQVSFKVKAACCHLCQRGKQKKKTSTQLCIVCVGGATSQTP